MKKIVFLLACWLISTTVSQAQDQDFTQFYTSPTTLNPALTGGMQSQFRVSFNYRDQWRNVLETPITTFAAAADFRFSIFNSGPSKKDAVGFGLVFYNDRPTSTYSTNQAMLGGAYHKSLDRRGEKYLSLGFQAGVAQRNTNYSVLSFDDQFDGNTGYNDPTQEVLPENNFAYGDFAVGLNYSYTPERSLGFNTGVSMYHILEPQIGAWYLDDIIEDYSGATLYRKYVAYFNLDIPVSQVVRVSPRALAYFQGPHSAYNAGVNFRFLANNVTGAALHLGTSLRLASDLEKNIGPDAGVVMAGFEYSRFMVGLSYDFNLDDFAGSKLGQGAFEISLAYLGEYNNETIICPKF